MCLKTWIVVSLILSVSTGFTQVLTEERLADETIYRSLEEALQNVNDVYILDLSKSKLDSIPNDVFQLVNLNKLLLKKNKIKHISPQIEKLKFLQELDLSKNKLEKFPVVLSNNSHLRILRLGSNEIEQVPMALGQLKGLVELDLWDNNLHNIPSEISNLKSLKKLDLRLAQFSDAEQKKIQSYTKAKVYFSNSCDCD